MIKNFSANSLDNIGYVSIQAAYKGKYVLCFHGRRKSWEAPGGHVEAGETALDAAKRELYEETGAINFQIIPLWDYQVINNEGVIHNNGRVFFAQIESFGALPINSEMEKIDFFDDLPDSLSYDRDEMLMMLNRTKELYELIKDKSNSESVTGEYIKKIKQ